MHPAVGGAWDAGETTKAKGATGGDGMMGDEATTEGGEKAVGLQGCSESDVKDRCSREDGAKSEGARLPPGREESASVQDILRFLPGRVPRGSGGM